jgi:Fe-S-cluster containining protein
MTLKQMLPDIYTDILPEDFLALAPNETKATCNACYKATKQAPPPHYDARLKCCTFYPFIPNYLVGAILAGPDSDGKAKVRELIRERRFALPIGLCAPPNYQWRFNATRSEGFGRDSDLLCPFYETKTGHCGIWRQRGHECATFFCVSSYGANGERFWSDVREGLHYTEMHISQEAMIFKGFDHQEISLNLEFIRRPDDDRDRRATLDAVDWSKLWAHHLEAIEEYYLATYAFARDHAKSIKKQVSDEKFRTDRIDTRVLSGLLVGGAVSKNNRHGSQP